MEVDAGAAFIKHYTIIAVVAGTPAGRPLAPRGAGIAGNRQVFCLANEPTFPRLPRFSLPDDSQVLT